MNNFDKDYAEEKAKRREKFKNKKKTENYIDDDSIKKNSLYKKEIKKIKESYEEEEWEDWDKYYNR
jgi:hypothetical protein